MESKEYKEGRNAYLVGADFDECPYGDETQEAGDWQAGWMWECHCVDDY